MDSLKRVGINGFEVYILARQRARTEYTFQVLQYAKRTQSEKLNDVQHAFQRARRELLGIYKVCLGEDGYHYILRLYAYLEQKAAKPDTVDSRQEYALKRQEFVLLANRYPQTHESFYAYAYILYASFCQRHVDPSTA